MKDEMVIATGLKGHVRALCARSTVLCEKARRMHDTSPVASLAMGRLLTGSLLIAAQMKGEHNTQTVHLRCDGPLRGMTSVCDAHGHVRGFCLEPVLDNSYDAAGRLIISPAVGKGTLTVIRDLGLKNPYTGTVRLVSGEIAADFSFYLAASEQTRSILTLGVLLGKANVLCAGGLYIALLPGADDKEIDFLEKRLSDGFPDVSFLLEEKMTPDDIIRLFLNDATIKVLDRRPIAYKCTCSRDRMAKNLMTLGRDEIATIAKDNKPIKTACQFCNSTYTFFPKDLDDMLFSLETDKKNQ